MISDGHSSVLFICRVSSSKFIVNELFPRESTDAKLFSRVLLLPREEFIELSVTDVPIDMDIPEYRGTEYFLTGS